MVSTTRTHIVECDIPSESIWVEAVGKSSKYQMDLTCIFFMQTLIIFPYEVTGPHIFPHDPPFPTKRTKTPSCGSRFRVVAMLVC